MNNSFRLVIGFTILSFNSGAIGQISGAGPRQLSLGSAFQLALQNRPEISLIHAQVGAAFARVRQAKSGMMPSIVLQGVATDGPQGAPGFGPLENPSLLGTSPLSLQGLAADPLKKQYGAGLTISQTLFDFGRTEHLVSARATLAGAALDDASSQIAMLYLRVEQTYYTVLLMKELAQVQAQNVKQREATFAQAKALVDAQLRSGVDLQSAAANLADAKTALVAATNQVHYAYAQLNNAMGETSMTEFELTTVSQSPRENAPETAQMAMELAVANRPEVFSATKQTSAANELIKGVSGSLRPRLDSIASFGAVRPSSLIASNKNYALGIVLSIPIFTGGFVEGRVVEEKEHQAAAKAQEQTVKESVRLQAAKAWLDFDTALNQVTSAEAQAKAARESLGLASERYRLQLSSIVELTDAEASMLKAEMQRANARYSVTIARSVLDWATGVTPHKYTYNVIKEKK